MLNLVKITFMNEKQIKLILEYLAKSKHSSKQIQKAYEGVLNALVDEGLCAKSMFGFKQLSTLLKPNVSDGEEAKKYLQKCFKNIRDKELETQLHEVFNSLMSGNFSKHKHHLKQGIYEFESSLNEVEAKMYVMIKTYIEIFCEALESFMIFDEKKQKSIQDVTNFALNIHEVIMKSIFYKEERVLLEQSLKQLSIVYIGLYYRSYYG